MDPVAASRERRFSSSEKLLAIGMIILAVISPLYIDRLSEADPEEEEDEPTSITSWLSLLFLVLIVAIALSFYSDQSLTKFDPYWIYRVGGSSGGLLVILAVLALILKCKASV